MICRTLLLSIVLGSTLRPVLASSSSFAVTGTATEPWRRVLSCVGLTSTPQQGSTISPDTEVLVAGPESTLDVAAYSETHFVILEGYSKTATALGLTAESRTVSVRQVADTHAIGTRIIWEHAQPVAVPHLPSDFRVFATERWNNTPVLAGKRTVRGGVLWVATSPGPTGIERYPYVLNALGDLGVTFPASATNLWAFFDSPYRIRADVDYLAHRWRQSGISALHVAAWHNMEDDPIQDEYLKRLIAACHRNAILVYAWLELPHVSEQFWAKHPEWREKTAIGQDAELDWRKLMNLENPDCHRAVEQQLSKLLQRFDWDGVNLAELYFESLEGATNPARFTPMNDDVRQQFKSSAGFDPQSLFASSTTDSAPEHAAKLRRFLDFRADLAARMQSDWLNTMEHFRSSKPWLDVVLTHIDDRFEPGIRDSLGADVARSLPLMRSHRSTLLIEDPAPLWNLGADRYAKLATQYNQIAPDRDELAVDLNIVERYQDVYPTKKQTGVELLQLVHQAALSFPRVAFYFESSLDQQDLQLLPAAAARAEWTAPKPNEMDVQAHQMTRIAWPGTAELDGKCWPVQNGESVLVPIGKHQLRIGTSQPPILIKDFNGDLRSVITQGNTVDLAYSSHSRAIATLGSPISSIDIDGALFWEAGKSATPSILLPAGQHIATFKRTTNQ